MTITNSHRFSVGGGGGGDTPAFGGASREFTFAGADSVEIPDVLGGTSSFSIAVWVKQPSFSGIRGIFGNWQETGLILRTNGSGVQFYTHMNSTTKSVSNNPSPSVDTWNHIAATCDGSTMTLYFNDSSIGTPASVSGALPTLTNQWWVHDPGSTSIQKQDCQLADARIYSKELSASEVSDLYAGTHVSDSLEAWYFTDNDDVDDYSGNARHGTNDGTTYSTDGPLD